MKTPIWHHRKYNAEIEGLQKTIEFYQSEISQETAPLSKDLKDTVALELERFAREKYLMKKRK